MLYNHSNFMNLNEKKFKLTSRNFILSLGTIAVAIAIFVITNIMFSTEKINIVLAMNKAYKQTNTDVTSTFNPKVKVPFDLEIEKNEQKSIDAGHSPWRLNPIFVSQVFVSLKLSPQGIIGEYPIKTEELHLRQNNGVEAIVQVSGNKTPIVKVYLKKLVKQDSTGIWTVVGYDPK